MITKRFAAARSAGDSMRYSPGDVLALQRHGAGGGNARGMSSTLDRLDLLALDDDLDDEDRLLRDTVRKFADDRLRPHIRQWFEDGTLPAPALGPGVGGLGGLARDLAG